MHKPSRGITLFELLISLALFGALVLVFVSIDLFSRHTVITSDRRAKIQNQVFYVLEHMGKEIHRAIGNINNPAADASGIGGDAGIRVLIDYNANGQWDGTGGGDRRIGYRLTGNQLRYCPQCTDVACTTCNPVWGSAEENILGKDITVFNIVYSSADNHADVTDIKGCFDPTGTIAACGSSDNPEVSMRAIFQMPSVSVN